MGTGLRASLRHAPTRYSCCMVANTTYNQASSTCKLLYRLTHLPQYDNVGSDKVAFEVQQEPLDTPQPVCVGVHCAYLQLIRKRPAHGI